MGEGTVVPHSTIVHNKWNTTFLRRTSASKIHYWENERNRNDWLTMSVKTKTKEHTIIFARSHHCHTQKILYPLGAYTHSQSAVWIICIYNTYIEWWVYAVLDGRFDTSIKTLCRAPRIPLTKKHSNKPSIVLSLSHSLPSSLFLFLFVFVTLCVQFIVVLELNWVILFRVFSFTLLLQFTVLLNCLHSGAFYYSTVDCCADHVNAMWIHSWIRCHFLNQFQIVVVPCWSLTVVLVDWEHEWYINIILRQFFSTIRKINEMELLKKYLSLKRKNVRCWMKMEIFLKKNLLLKKKNLRKLFDWHKP